MDAILGRDELLASKIGSAVERIDTSFVAVIGTPDARLGEISTAIIQLKEGEECTEEEMNNFCLELPRYKRPRQIIFADVPRNATGKIEKPALREKYGAANLVDRENRR